MSASNCKRAINGAEKMTSDSIAWDGNVFPGRVNYVLNVSASASACTIVGVNYVLNVSASASACTIVVVVLHNSSLAVPILSL